MWGRREYLLPDKSRIPVDAGLAWCNGCSNLVAAEVIDCGAKAQERRILESQRSKLQEALVGRSGFVRSLTGLGSAETERIRDDLRHCDQMIERSGVYLNAMSNRQSPPRCLKCSGTAVVGVIIPALRDDEQRVRTGFIHPRCGGQFIATLSSIYWSMTFPNIDLFDLDGRFLGFIDTDSRSFVPAGAARKPPAPAPHTPWSTRAFSIKASGK